MAMDAARESEAAVMRGDSLGPLHGVPVPVKDTEPMSEVIWTHGSLTYKDDTPSLILCRYPDLKLLERSLLGRPILLKTDLPVLQKIDGGPPARNPWDPI
ncbi:MAG: hypothetical protein Ct9H300mP19_14630 [Dehalococcoidia bacterium]|nr:MAG: hypothetical protein Ct9H300mP19_14630 [Dehalococcoidia bacterium]